MSPHQEPTLILSNNDIIEVLNRVGCHHFMDQLIARIQTAFAEFDSSEISVPIRDGFHYDSPATGLIEWMPLYQHGQNVLMKTVGYHPDNPVQKNLPTILSTSSLFDSTTGSLLALVDGLLLTALRTGAASAVATQLLSRDESSSLGLIGCGAQSITQLHAISRIRNLKTVRYFDINSDVMNSFPNRALPVIDASLELIPASIEATVELSDILCTATSIGIGEGPLFDGISTSESLHINGVGSDLTGKTELPLSLLSNSVVCPDFTEQAMKEGECQQLKSDQIGPSILEVAKNPNNCDQFKNQRTVFDSTGWALEDYVCLELACEYAEEFKIGQRMHIEGTLRDPWNPYDDVFFPKPELVKLSKNQSS